MLKIKLIDGTEFRWEQREGLVKLSGNCGVAELARIKLEEIEFVEANGDEKQFITRELENVRTSVRGTTRWIGEDARFIANNLRNVATAQKRYLKKQRKRRKNN